VDVIAIEAGKTLLLDQSEVFRSCAELRVSLLAIDDVSAS